MGFKEHLVLGWSTHPDFLSPLLVLALKILHLGKLLVLYKPRRFTHGVQGQPPPKINCQNVCIFAFFSEGITFSKFSKQSIALKG